MYSSYILVSSCLSTPILHCLKDCNRALICLQNNGRMDYFALPSSYTYIQFGQEEYHQANCFQIYLISSRLFLFVFLKSLSLLPWQQDKTKRFSFNIQELLLSDNVVLFSRKALFSILKIPLTLPFSSLVNYRYPGQCPCQILISSRFKHISE